MDPERAPSATSPGSSAPMRAIRPRRSPTSSTAAISPRARPASPSPSTCRPRPATTPTTRWRAARSARSACRLPSRRHAGAVRRHPARRDEHLDDHQRHGGLAAGALRRRRRRAGRARAALTGTTQNDIIKEYLSRGTYVFPPAPSHAADQGHDPLHRPARCRSGTRPTSAPTTCRRRARRRCRSWPSRSPPRMPCSTPSRRPARSRPPTSAEVVGRISFFVNAGIRFITEICKMRAFTELWDEITRERYGVTDAKHRRFRYGVQVNSLGLTEQQPENNVYRILHRDAGGHAVEGRARPRRAASGLERGARPAAARGTSNGRSACSRSWPMRPTCWNTATSSTARR